MSVKRKKTFRKERRRRCRIPAEAKAEKTGKFSVINISTSILFVNNPEENNFKNLIVIGDYTPELNLISGGFTLW